MKLAPIAFRRVAFTMSALFMYCAATLSAATPNIVIILCDDLGFGDVRCNNPTSAIPTPHIDSLAKEGIRFTDAYTPASVCTPTRYGLLTGRYCWRSRLKKGVLDGYSPHLIERDRPTLGDLAKMAGYTTACIGKWHLGMDLPRIGKEGNQLDYSLPIANGPTAAGFDHFFGITASLDFPPYAFIENDRFIEPASGKLKGGDFPGYVRPGTISSDFDHRQALGRIIQNATQYVGNQAERDRPFLLYLPLTSPHKPVLPEARFLGRSGKGPYGDFIMQTDAAIGSILKSIQDAGIAAQTLVMVTSDNGSFMYNLDSQDCPPQHRRSAVRGDHAVDATVHGFHAQTHRANGVYRGTKADIWEAGSRVPLVVRWPDVVRPGGEVCHPVSLVDIFATLAELLEQPLLDNTAEDSYSLLPLLSGKGESYTRGGVVIHSVNGTFAIRSGNWKLILGNGSGGRGVPRGEPFGKPFQLYDLALDPAETDNVIEEHLDIAEELESLLQEYRQSGRSRG